jgi:hypothetical protein
MAQEKSSRLARTDRHYWIHYAFDCRSGWSTEWMALAYRLPSIVEIFHAHLQTRQKPHPPGLRTASVNEPEQSWQAQHRVVSRSTARALSNTCSRAC